MRGIGDIGLAQCCGNRAESGQTPAAYGHGHAQGAHIGSLHARGFRKSHRGSLERETGASSAIPSHAANRRAVELSVRSRRSRADRCSKATNPPHDCSPTTDSDAGGVKSRIAGHGAGHDRLSAHLRGGSPTGVQPLVGSLGWSSRALRGHARYTLTSARTTV